MIFIKPLPLVAFFLLAFKIGLASNTVTFPVKLVEGITDSAKLDLPFEFHELNLLIRDTKIDKQEALAQLIKILQNSREKFYLQYTRDTVTKTWTFPLQNYDYKSIGGTNGSGYFNKQFDYFDVSAPGGHPAQDIFIRDKNQDNKDDKTLQPVGVLSVTSGIVLDIETCWTPDSIWKGGKYIHIFDPLSGSILYYAHNDTVMVRAGDMVKQGDLIAYVGRTGLRAYPKRSQTHLHFSQLKLDENGYPRPVNPYYELVRAKSINLSAPSLQMGIPSNSSPGLNAANSTNPTSQIQHLTCLPYSRLAIPTKSTFRCFIMDTLLVE